MAHGCSGGASLLFAKAGIPGGLKRDATISVVSVLTGGRKVDGEGSTEGLSGKREQDAPARGNVLRGSSVQDVSSPGSDKESSIEGKEFHLLRTSWGRLSEYPPRDPKRQRKGTDRWSSSHRLPGKCGIRSKSTPEKEEPEL